MVFAGSGISGVMGDRDLFDLAALQLHQGRDKTMHADEEGHPPGIGCFDYFQRAAGVFDTVIDQESPVAIGKFGGESLDEGIFSFPPDAVDHVVFREKLEEFQEVGGMSLQIGIDIANQ